VRVAPLSPRRYELRVTIDEETHDRLRQLQDLMSHQVPGRDPAVIVAQAISDLYEKTLARKAGVTKRPRTRAPAASAPSTRESRHVPASVRRVVWSRDGGRCKFVDVRGQRCPSTSLLQYHHINNWARGAKHMPDEIELRCRAHNLYQAEIDYGADFIAARRTEAGSRAGERRAPYRPSSASMVHPSAEAASALRPRLTPPPPRRTFSGECAHARAVSRSSSRSSSASCWRCRTCRRRPPRSPGETVARPAARETCPSWSR
jgi:hypothetical protein